MNLKLIDTILYLANCVLNDNFCVGYIYISEDINYDNIYVSNEFCGQNKEIKSLGKLLDVHPSHVVPLKTNCQRAEIKRDKGIKLRTLVMDKEKRSSATLIIIGSGLKMYFVLVYPAAAEIVDNVQYVHPLIDYFARKYLFTLVSCFTEYDVSCYLFLLQRELYTRTRK